MTTILKFFTLIILIIFNISCSISSKYFHSFYPTTVKQGIYLNKEDIQKIQIGMTKSEILSNIGSPPTLKNIFGSNIWYYVYHYTSDTNQLQYCTIILKFDLNDNLCNIDILNLV